MEKKYVVGVDCGTTSSKTVIFDFKGKQIGVGQKLNPLVYPSPGRVECDGSSGAKQGDSGKAAIRVTATIICHYKRLRRMEVWFGEEEGPLLKKGIFLPKAGSPK